MFIHMCSVCPGGDFKSASKAGNLLANELPPQAQNLGTYFWFYFHKTVYGWNLHSWTYSTRQCAVSWGRILRNVRMSQSSCTVQLKHTVCLCSYVFLSTAFISTSSAPALLTSVFCFVPHRLKSSAVWFSSLMSLRVLAALRGSDSLHHLSLSLCFSLLSLSTLFNPQ